MNFTITVNIDTRPKKPKGHNKITKPVGHAHHNLFFAVFLQLILFRVIPLLLVLFQFSVGLLKAETVGMIVVSDTHGYIDSKVFHPGRKSTGLAYLASKIIALRKNDPELFLISAGDALSGSPLSRMYISRGTAIPQNTILKNLPRS